MGLVFDLFHTTTTHHPPKVVQGAGEGLVASQSFRLNDCSLSMLVTKNAMVAKYHFIATAQSYTWCESEGLPEQLYVPH